MARETLKSLFIIAGLMSLMAGLYFILPPYHQVNLVRIMVLAVFACAYNIAYGYCGLLSLGHALFFAVGMYGFAFLLLGGVAVWAALLSVLVIGGVSGAIVGLLALRTQKHDKSGAAFMIVTLLFAAAAYWTIIYFGTYTRADEGFNLSPESRRLGDFSITDNAVRYCAAVIFLTAVLCLKTLLRFAPIGRVWIAVRENPIRAELCGYNVFAYRLWALVISAMLAAMAGAVYAWLFGYVGASFADVAYSILPLLWVLVGGVGTIIGPVIGTALMFYAVDWSSDITQAYWAVVGVMLVVLMLWGRGGIIGLLKKRGLTWIP